MSFGEAVASVLSKYGDFSGRARRSEFWYWVLALFLVEIVIAIIYPISDVLAIILWSVVGLGVIIPYLAVTVRRLHDTNRSGWWFFIYFVPLIGPFWLLVLMFLDSSPGTNTYGPSPKEA